MPTNNFNDALSMMKWNRAKLIVYHLFDCPPVAGALTAAARRPWQAHGWQQDQELSAEAAASGSSQLGAGGFLSQDLLDRGADVHAFLPQQYTSPLEPMRLKEANLDRSFNFENDLGEARLNFNLEMLQPFGRKAASLFMKKHGAHAAEEARIHVHAVLRGHYHVLVQPEDVMVFRNAKINTRLFRSAETQAAGQHFAEVFFPGHAVTGVGRRTDVVRPLYFFRVRARIWKKSQRSQDAPADQSCVCHVRQALEQPGFTCGTHHLHSPTGERVSHKIYQLAMVEWRAPVLPSAADPMPGQAAAAKHSIFVANTKQQKRFTELHEKYRLAPSAYLVGEAMIGGKSSDSKNQVSAVNKATGGGQALVATRSPCVSLVRFLRPACVLRGSGKLQYTDTVFFMS